jgi:amphi-Trp domain-containing protein
MSKQQVQLSGTMEKELVISILDEILSSMKKGQLTFQSGQESFSLTPASELKMEIKAKSDKNKQKLEIELTWQIKQKLITSVQEKIVDAEKEKKHIPVKSTDSSVRLEGKDAASDSKPMT